MYRIANNKQAGIFSPVISEEKRYIQSWCFMG